MGMIGMRALQVCHEYLHSMTEMYVLSLWTEKCVSPYSELRCHLPRQQGDLSQNASSALLMHSPLLDCVHLDINVRHIDSVYPYLSHSPPVPWTSMLSWPSGMTHLDGYLLDVSRASSCLVSTVIKHCYTFGEDDNTSSIPFTPTQSLWELDHIERTRGFQRFSWVWKFTHLSICSDVFTQGCLDLVRGCPWVVIKPKHDLEFRILEFGHGIVAGYLLHTVSDHIIPKIALVFWRSHKRFSSRTLRTLTMRLRKHIWSFLSLDSFRLA